MNNVIADASLNVCFFVLFFPADIISTVEFNHTGELLATGDKGGRVVIFQQEIEVQLEVLSSCWVLFPQTIHIRQGHPLNVLLKL